jgi:hypothetical protein
MLPANDAKSKTGQNYVAALLLADDFELYANFRERDQSKWTVSTRLNRTLALNWH